MDIRWMGGSSFELRGDTTTVITDPLSPPSDEAAVCLHTRRDAAAGPKAGGRPFVIDGPGEYEVTGVFIVGTEGPTPSDQPSTRHSVYSVLIDEVRVAHVGRLSAAPAEAAVEALGGVDVLLLPLHQGGLSASDAADVVARLEPSFVLPVAIDAPNVLAAFVKEMGANDLEPARQFRALPNRMPEETQVALLQSAEDA